MTAPDVAAIARGLTKAQRELLVEGDGCVRSYKPAQRLVTLGLWYDDGDEYQLRPHYTPLGLAVRAYLMENPR